jgi:2-haloacid dehalogenase
MVYHWLLFDADNTLLDYNQAETVALSQAFDWIGHPFTAEAADTYRQVNHRLWLAFEAGELSQELLRVRRFAQLFEALGLETDPQTASEQYLTYLGQSQHLLPGARELLASLSERYRLAMITNGLKEVQRSRLAVTGLDRLFDPIIISEEVGAAKPDRKIFDIAFEQMGHPDRSQVLMIGDGLTSDIQGGFDYGIDTCWYNPNSIVCELDITITYEIRTLSELLPILDQTGK